MNRSDDLRPYDEETENRVSTKPAEHPRRPSRRWRGLRDLDPIIISCRDDHQAHRAPEQRTGLCDRCLADLELVLSDVPYLLDDLDIAISGQVEFVERGQRRDQTEEEQERGGGNPAVLAHQRLVRALEVASDWFDARHPEQLAAQLRRVLPELADEPALRKVARQVSQAAARAHRVTDAPPALWYYGPCPLCGQDLLQERIPEGDRGTLVTCRRCQYADTAPGHNATQLAARANAWLTETELVSAFASGGQPITRDRLKNLIARQDIPLPRERRSRPRWVSGHLQYNEVWCYRVADVRALVERAQTKRATHM